MYVFHFALGIFNQKSFVVDIIGNSIARLGTACFQNIYFEKNLNLYAMPYTSIGTYMLGSFCVQTNEDMIQCVVLENGLSSPQSVQLTGNKLKPNMQHAHTPLFVC